jgi:hypothetical protein
MTTIQTQLKARIEEALIQAAFRVGQLNACTEVMHTCGSDSRYPWPPDCDCPACRSRVEKFVESNHLELAYRLYGFQAMVDHYQRELNWRSEKARIARSLGSGI